MKLNIKSLKITREAVILGLLALLCLLYILFRDNGRMNYSLPEFKPLETDQFTSLQLDRPGLSPVVLEKAEGQWRVQTDGFAADPGKVGRILEFLTTVEPVDLVSQSGNPSRYDLDEEHRITLTGFHGESRIREIYLGKLSSSENYTYVQFLGDKNVYTLRGTLKSVTGLEAGEFRDKTVMKIDRNDINRIAFTGAGDTAVLARGGDDSWSDLSGNVRDAGEVTDLLGRFSNLTCLRFLDSPPEGPETSAFTLSGTREYTLTLYPKTDEGYPAVSSEASGPFLLTGYTGDTLLQFFQSPSGDSPGD